MKNLSCNRAPSVRNTSRSSRRCRSAFFVVSAVALCSALAAVGCDRQTLPDATRRPPNVGSDNASGRSRDTVPLGLDTDWPFASDPAGPARARLGRLLFHDRRLSVGGTVACATCHRVEHAFSEPLPVSIGVRGQHGHRKAPALINQTVKVYPHFFRDGRATSLEAQALEPLRNPREMGNTRDEFVTAIQSIAGYRPYVLAAFGTPDVSEERITRAIADYVRTLMSGNSPWDRWRRHRDESAVSDQVRRGHELFFGKAGCNQCHLGSNFTDDSFHNLGIGWDSGTRRFQDEGRYAITKRQIDTGAFRTPTLREVTKHPPYMHDGSLSTMRDVLEWYNRGGEQNPYLDGRLQPLNLTDDEIGALIAFLEALEGEGHQEAPPASFPQ
jgi:cytochrome c peroxidase